MSIKIILINFSLIQTLIFKISKFKCIAKITLKMYKIRFFLVKSKQVYPITIIYRINKISSNNNIENQKIMVTYKSKMI